MPDGPESLPEPTWSIDGALRRTLGVAIVPLNAPGKLHNIHFRATTSAGSATFVKVFNDRDYWHRAIAAAVKAEPLLRTPRLLDYGELGPGHWWARYEWLDIEPFAPTTDHLEQLGAMLGQLHASTRGSVAGLTEHDLDAEIAERAGHLTALDADTADRVRALHARWGPTELPGDIGLIHGDFHWRNVGLVDGAPVLFDLESMRAAQPIVDFGKLVDLDGLTDNTQRKAFFQGYERHAAPVWPWGEAMRAVRLWTTCGVLVYSLAMGLDGFAAHGRQRLDELESTVR